MTRTPLGHGRGRPRVSGSRHRRRASGPPAVLGADRAGGLTGGGGLHCPVLLGTHPADRVGEGGELGEQGQHLGGIGPADQPGRREQPAAARSPDPGGSGSRPHAWRAARS